MPSADWFDRARCRGMDTELFYPWRYSVSQLTASQAALDACAECPVRAECLAWAIEHDEDGIWGGTTPRERIPGLPSLAELNECRECGRLMRPRGTTAQKYPGTVLAVSPTRCGACATAASRRHRGRR